MKCPDAATERMGRSSRRQRGMGTGGMAEKIYVVDALVKNGAS